jgi:hypothetical protein
LVQQVPSPLVVVMIIWPSFCEEHLNQRKAARSGRHFPVHEKIHI